jgi:hypothetical protein
MFVAEEGSVAVVEFEKREARDFRWQIDGNVNADDDAVVRTWASASRRMATTLDE